jgi:thiamine pyrophosphate-dependent acetolactate synthase large subunit-like protein
MHPGDERLADDLFIAIEDVAQIIEVYPTKNPEIVFENRRDKMNTNDLLHVLMRAAPPDVSVICSLGRTAEKVFEHYPQQTLFLDSMGDVVPVACGVALGTRPLATIALDTDGSHLFGLAALPTVASLKYALDNLLILVADNKHYESAGNLPSRYCSIDWPRLGEAFGLEIHVAENVEDVAASLTTAFKALTFVVASVENSDDFVPGSKNVDGIESRYLFMRHVERLLGRPLPRPSFKS